MDERRKRLLGESDDADVRGEHEYPTKTKPNRSVPVRQTGTVSDDALTREPCQYVAGAEGTQPITTPTTPKCD
jgi:hypothetical protein